jgi:hypothetical protein
MTLEFQTGKLEFLEAEEEFGFMYSVGVYHADDGLPVKG